MTLKVVHVINTAEVGGGGEHLVQLVRSLNGYGFSSTVAIGKDGPATKRLRESGASVTVLGSLRLTASLRLASFFRAMRPDIVHLHGSRAGLTGTIASQLSHTTPVVYTAHAFAFKRRLPRLLLWAAAAIDRYTCHHARRVICLTQKDVEAAVRQGFAVNNIAVIPNGIDVGHFVSHSDRRKEFGFRASAPVVGMIARLVPDKDPLTFVRMARYVADAVPGTRFLLVGDGPLRAHVDRLIRESSLNGEVRITGFRTDIPEMLATMDVVVLTSLWEGLPLVVLETMAAGKPIVATALPSLEEVIVSGKTGVLVPSHDPSKLGEAVVQLLEHAELRETMGQRGQDRVKRHFSLDQMVEATVNVYRSVLSSRITEVAKGGN